jgi:hypothetical protein
MTLVQSSFKAGTANFTVHLMMLAVGGCISLRFVFGGPFLGVALSYLFWNSDHLLCLGCICEQTNPFKKSNYDIKGFLCQSACCQRNTPPISVPHDPRAHCKRLFTKHLVEPLSDHGIDAHIRHERGECPPLSNAPSIAKRLPIISPKWHRFDGGDTGCARPGSGGA